MKDINLVDSVNHQISYLKQNAANFEAGKVSDGFHTFKELYEFRKIYNAALFNEWAKNYNGDYSGLNNASDFPNYKKIGKHYNVHKSWRHFDGSLCFPNSKERWFIVCAKLPTGLISNHYAAKDWDLFRIPEVDKAMFPFDGHDGAETLRRIKETINYYQ